MTDKLFHDAHAVFCEVFQSDISYEAFRHKHMDNPEMSRENSTLVNYQEGIPAGTNSFMGCMALDGKALLYSVQSCDTAVKTAFRGRHIFSGLIQQAISACCQNQTAFIFGFPNQNSYSGFLKLGFFEVGQLSSYATIIRPVHLLLRKILGQAPELAPFKEFSSQNEGDWSLTFRCPFTEEDLFFINSRPGIHFQRSLAFYQWKIDHVPKGEAAYLCARKGGQLEAFLVLRRYSNGICDLCDWILPDDAAASRRLLKRALRLLRPFCDLLNVPMVNPTREETAHLKNSNFIKKKKNGPCPFLIYPTADLDEETLSRLKEFRNWSLRYIDGDTILNE